MATTTPVCPPVCPPPGPSAAGAAPAGFADELYRGLRAAGWQPIVHSGPWGMWVDRPCPHGAIPADALILVLAPASAHLCSTTYTQNIRLDMTSGASVVRLLDLVAEGVARTRRPAPAAAA